MRTDDLVLVQGIHDTRQTLASWNRDPGPVLGGWFRGSVTITAGLLFAVWVVALFSTPDPTPMLFPGYHTPVEFETVGRVLFRNSLVLALHSMACVAGFIAGSSLPQEAHRYSGVWRKIHDHAGPLAIGFVVCATAFSLLTQAFVLGGGAATLAAQLDITSFVLLFALLPHALPELVGLFLPLAAWLIASRRGDWHELLAATFVTTAIAIPLLVISAFIEVFLSPHLIGALAG